MTAKDWINVCSQLTEVVRYLHEDVRCIHNDIKTDNILLTNASTVASSASSKFNVFLIDYGKATEKSLGKLYKLSDTEKLLYRSQHPHLAPEIIDGVVKQSTTSDMYSIGKVLQFICDKHKNVTEEEKHYISKLKSVAEQCTSDKIFSRPPAFLLLEALKDSLVP